MADPERTRRLIRDEAIVLARMARRDGRPFLAQLLDLAALEATPPAERVYADDLCGANGEPDDEIAALAEAIRR